MTTSDAQARLERMVAHDSEPTLSADEITDLLTQSEVVDADGLAPSDAGYTATWDLNIGAAEGWRWKAAKCAGLHDYSTVGLSVSRSQQSKMCLDMAASYARKRIGSVPVRGQLARTDD
jgi:hypothetical protein